MMKRFITAMLGSLAGIWLSVILFSMLFYLTIIVLIIGAGSSSMLPDISDNSVLYLNLSGEISEQKKPTQWVDDIYGTGTQVLPLNNILGAINAAASDDRINGIYINCDGSSAGLATRKEIVNAINKFKASGKWVYAYADSYTQGDYYIACTADSLFINPLGSVDIRGLAATTYFYKGLLDKVGVEMQIIKVGTYKSAVEPYILTEMSDASRLQQEHYIGVIWRDICDDIATMRGVNTEIVNNWADSLTVTQPTATYIERNIVDKLVYRHEIEDKLKELCDVDEDDDVNLITPENYCATEDVLNPDDSDNQIAVLYAVGNIVDDGTEGIVGRTMAPQILEIAKDDDIKALVLRVNSGGGSAFASEQIWEALEQFKKTGKPFYVSMGDVAASGGYYISCGADCIYAEPVTLTGSIGIFGMIPCAKDLMENKLGVTQGTVSSNANGDFLSLTNPMSEYQRRSMQEMINEGYENFVYRCATGRNVSTDSIKAIAEGRVWDGITAFNIGLVDKLGGLNDAVSDIADELGFSSYKIVEYPSSTTDIWSLLFNAKAHITQQVISEELGDAYIHYNTLKQIRNINPIQCRMENVIIK